MFIYILRGGAIEVQPEICFFFGKLKQEEEKRGGGGSMTGYYDALLFGEICIIYHYTQQKDN